MVPSKLKSWLLSGQQIKLILKKQYPVIAYYYPNIMNLAVYVAMVAIKEKRFMQNQYRVI